MAMQGKDVFKAANYLRFGFLNLDDMPLGLGEKIGVCNVGDVDSGRQVAGSQTSNKILSKSSHESGCPKC